MTKIWHDPGHGGSNKGLEHEGFVERDWNLEFARLLTDELAEEFPEQQIARHADITLGYGTRARKARQWGANLALLHHVNAAFWPASESSIGELCGSMPRLYIRGAICFVVQCQMARLERMTRILLRHLPETLRRTKNDLIVARSGNWTGDAYGHLHYYSELGIPAVLIEWGFATNPNDLETLQDAEARLQMVEAVAAALRRFEET
jgi:N-acetylmuramoyl-L-alanine amidase